MSDRDVLTVVGNGQHQPPLRQNSHHSDKIATTTNLLISTKISTPMKIFNLNCQLLYVTYICSYICSVYKQFPMYNLSTEIKDHKFWRFKAHLYNHRSSKPGHIPIVIHWVFISTNANACLPILHESTARYKEILGEFTIKHSWWNEIWQLSPTLQQTFILVSRV